MGFSFGIDPKNTEKYELVARAGSNDATDLTKYTTLGKVQNFLDTHENSALHFRRKYEIGERRSDASERVEVAERKSEDLEGNEARLLSQRKRSNSIS